VVDVEPMTAKEVGDVRFRALMATSLMGMLGSVKSPVATSIMMDFLVLSRL
jgi:hypothetical protein